MITIDQCNKNSVLQKLSVKKKKKKQTNLQVYPYPHFSTPFTQSTGI